MDAPTRFELPEPGKKSRSNALPCCPPSRSDRRFQSKGNSLTFEVKIAG
jgi:hypothetical protein